MANGGGHFPLLTADGATKIDDHPLIVLCCSFFVQCKMSTNISRVFLGLLLCISQAGCDEHEHIVSTPIPVKVWNYAVIRSKDLGLYLGFQCQISCNCLRESADSTTSILLCFCEACCGIFSGQFPTYFVGLGVFVLVFLLV